MNKNNSQLIIKNYFYQNNVFQLTLISKVGKNVNSISLSKL